MRKTIFSHFYNEEYLLPWWLKHHREIFDHGVMINYASTDSSVDIIRDLCPTWEIVDSINHVFDATIIEREIENYELHHKGWKMVLNTTEFIIGDFKKLDDYDLQAELICKCHIMVDSEENEFREPDKNLSLLKTRTNGIDLTLKHSEDFSKDRGCRLIHKNDEYRYPLGRHYHESNTDLFHVLWYGYSPFTERLLERKLQIKDRIPLDNIKRKLGFEHMYPREKMIEEMKRYQRSSNDMSDFINKHNQ